MRRRESVGNKRRLFPVNKWLLGIISCLAFFQKACTLDFIFPRCLISSPRCFGSKSHWHFISIQSKAAVSDFKNVFRKWNLFFGALTCFISIHVLRSSFLTRRIIYFTVAIYLAAFVTSDRLSLLYNFLLLMLLLQKDLFLKAFVSLKFVDLMWTKNSYFVNKDFIYTKKHIIGGLKRRKLTLLNGLFRSDSLNNSASVKRLILYSSTNNNCNCSRSPFENNEKLIFPKWGAMINYHNINHNESQFKSTPTVWISLRSSFRPISQFQWQFRSRILTVTEFWIVSLSYVYFVLALTAWLSFN